MLELIELKNMTTCELKLVIELLKTLNLGNCSSTDIRVESAFKQVQQLKDFLKNTNFSLEDIVEGEK